MTSTATSRAQVRSLGTLLLAVVCALALLAQLSTRPALAGGTTDPQAASSAGPVEDGSSVEPEPSPSEVIPAPPGFADELRSVYDAQYDLNTLLGADLGPAPSREEFSSQVGAMSQESLDAMYAALQGVPEWEQLTDVLTTTTQVLPEEVHGVAAEGGSAEVSRSFDASGGGARTASGPSASSAEEQSGAGFSAASADELPDSLEGIDGEKPGDCDFEAVGPVALLGLGITIEVLSLILDVLGQIKDLLGLVEKTGTAVAVLTTISIVLIIARAALAIAAEVISYQRALAGDCLQVAARNFGQNVDANLVITYDLISSLRPVLARIDTTTQETLAGVQDVDADLVVTTDRILTTLAQNLNDMQSSIGGSTGVNVTYLQQLQQIMDSSQLSLADAIEVARAQLLAADGAGSTELQAQVSDSLTRTLAEIGVAHDQLRSRLDARTQELLDAAELDSSTSRAEALAALRADIEEALASKHARTLYRLPVSRGGLLDATPVGVQQIVNDDFRMMNEIGARIEPSAVKALNDANAAVQAGQWLVAYGYFETAYLGMINAK